MFSVQLDSGKSISSEFWKKYEILYGKTITQSPFYSSVFLKTLINDSDNSKLLFISAYDEEGNMIGALFLREDGKNRVVFFNDGHSDHNPFIIASTLSIQDQKQIINDIVSVFPNYQIFYLTNIPVWHNHLDWLMESLKNNNWYTVSTSSWDCPCVVYIESKSVSNEEFFQKKFNKPRLNNYHNRLKKMAGYEYEVYDSNDFELEKWISEYCDNHEERWNVTDTPSRYRFTFQRDLIYKKAKAWHSAGQLVRFSIKVNSRRIATVLCYKQGRDRLIYGLPSFSPEYNNLQPGAVLVSCIGKWAGQNGYSVLDFGVGSEKYKFRYANENQILYRVFASKKRYSSILVRGWVEKRVRMDDKLNKLWSYWNDGGYRKYKNMQEIGLQRLKTSLSLIVSNPIYHIKRVIKTKISPKVIYYIIEKEADKSFNKLIKFDIVQPKLSSILQFMNDNPGFTPKSRTAYIRRYYNNGTTPFAVIGSDGRILQLSWVSDEIEEHVSKAISTSDDKTILKIYDCITTVSHRGKGLYPAVLRYIVNKKVSNAVLVIYTDDWNIPSQRGIIKAGFREIGILNGKKAIE